MNKRYEWLASIRGLACMLVVISHLVGGGIRNSGLGNAVTDFLGIFIYKIFDFGKIGVCIFFLISGYLLPMSVKNKTTKEFVVNRFIRLYPTYWFSIILGTIFLGTATSALQFLVNATMFQTYVGVDNIVTAHWTLCIELGLYIFCILFKKYLYNKKFLDVIKVLGSIVTVLLAGLRYITNIKLPVAYLLLLMIALLGYSVRRYVEAEISRRELVKDVVHFVLVLFVTCILAYNKDMGWDETWYRYFLSYSMAIFSFLFFCFMQVDCLFFKYIGNMSYSIYLTHTIVITFLFKTVFGSGMSTWLVLLISIVFIYGIAWITYKVIEVPSTKFLKKKLEGK